MAVRSGGSSPQHSTRNLRASTWAASVCIGLDLFSTGGPSAFRTRGLDIPVPPAGCDSLCGGARAPRVRRFVNSSCRASGWPTRAWPNCQADGSRSRSCAMPCTVSLRPGSVVRLGFELIGEPSSRAALQARLGGRHLDFGSALRKVSMKEGKAQRQSLGQSQCPVEDATHRLHAGTYRSR